MKKICLIFSLILVIVFVSGCQVEQENNKTDLFDTETGYEVEKHSIKQSVKVIDGNRIKVEYPTIIGTNKNYDVLNEIITDKIDEWIINSVSDDSTADVKYIITLDNGDYLSILFEGTISNKSAAHPTAEVFSIVLSMTKEEIVDPLSIIEINNSFVDCFKTSALNYSDTDRFTDEQNKAVVDYILSFSDEELKEMIKNAELAFSEEGVWVCLGVPHAIGDYLKIYVNGKFF